MILDIICIATILVWAVFGYRKGFIKQIFALAGVAGIALFSVPIAEIIETIISKDMGMMITSRFLKGALLAASAALIYVFCYAVGRFLHDTLVKGISFAESTNHILGTSLGVIESTMGLFFVLCLISMVQDKVKDYAPAVYEAIDQSRAFHIADENNLVKNSEFFTKYRQQESAASPEQNKADKPSDAENHDNKQK